MNSNLNIKIDDDVLEYLGKKNKDYLVLNILVSGGGCCPTFETAEIELKKPSDEEKYQYELVDDIHVYVPKNAQVNVPILRFVLEGSGIFKHISPKGLSLKTH